MAINFEMNATGNLAQSLDQLEKKTETTDAAMERLNKRLTDFRSTSNIMRSQFGGMENTFSAFRREAVTSMAGVSNAVDNMETTVSRVAPRVEGAFGSMFRAVGGRANRAALQNTAFQLQDIIVQLEAGVPLTRTMAQQLPQLTGGFGAYGAAIGVVLGGFFALLPVIANATGLFSDQTAELKAAAKALETLEEIEAGFSDVIRDQADAYDYASEAAKRFLEQRETLARESVAETTKTLIADLIAPEMETVLAPGVTPGTGSLMDSISAYMNGPQMAMTSRATGRSLLASDAAIVGDGSGLSDDQSVQAAEILLEMSKKELSTRQQIAEAYLEANTALEEMGLSAEQINSITGDLVTELGIVEEVAALAAEEYDKIGDRQEAIADGAEAFRNVWAEIKDRATELGETMREESGEMERQTTLALVKARYGEDSASYAQAKVRADREEYIEGLRSKGVQEDVLDILEDQFSELQRAKGETDTLQVFMSLAETAAEGFRDALNDSSLGHIIADIGTIIGMLPAAGPGILSGIQARFYATPAGQTYKNYMDYKTNPGDVDDPVLGGRGNVVPDKTDIMLAGLGGVVGTPPGKAKTGKSGGGGGKSVAEEIADFWKEQERVIEQTERLVGVYGKNRDILEQQIDLEDELFGIKGKLSENDKTRISDLAEQLVLLEERDQKERDLYETMSSSIQGFLDETVQNIDNIEDAFTSMLQNILMEIWQQEVSKPITNTILSLFSANGNAFGPGGVTPFASGGVFGSPTLFNYGGGKTGVMGEAGPEAVMPLKRGKDGKLGVAADSGGGATTVNQYFNFSANGDESVQRIIDQNIPRISQAGVSSMISMKKSGRLKGVFS